MKYCEHCNTKLEHTDCRVNNVLCEKCSEYKTKQDKRWKIAHALATPSHHCDEHCGLAWDIEYELEQAEIRGMERAGKVVQKFFERQVEQSD